MDPISGYCLTCKSYGPVLEGQIKTMSNGRKRIAGSCEEGWVQRPYLEDHRVTATDGSLNIRLEVWAHGLVV